MSENLVEENKLLKMKLDTAMAMLQEQSSQIRVYIDLYQQLIESHSRIITMFEAHK